MKKKIIFIFIVFLVIGVSIFYFLTTGNIGTKYNTFEVKEVKVEEYVEAIGKVSSKNIRRYYGNGINKVDNMNLEIGEIVEKGELLVKYEDNLDLEVKKVKKEIEALEASYGEILSGNDMENINNARIEIFRIKSDLELERKNKARTEKLYNSGAVSLNELEQMVNKVKQLESNLSKAENTYNKLIKDVSKYTKKKYEAEIEVLILKLKSIERDRKDYSIFSDINGIVTKVDTFKGDVPPASTLILEIQDPNEKVLLVDFMVEDSQKIKKGMKAVIIDNKFNINDESLKVNKIYPKAFITFSELDVKENRQTIEISLPKSFEKLPYGLELKTKVVIEESKKSLMIPIEGIYKKDLKQYVKILKDGELIEKEIVTGIKVDNKIEIIEGLESGDLVIMNYQQE